VQEHPGDLAHDGVRRVGPLVLEEHVGQASEQGLLGVGGQRALGDRGHRRKTGASR
jgi:hypothetical protein